MNSEAPSGSPRGPPMEANNPPTAYKNDPLYIEADINAAIKADIK